MRSDSKNIKSMKVRDMLYLLAPWCRLDLHGDFSLEPVKGAPTDEWKQKQFATWTVLNNLFYLTLTFGDIFLNEIERLWEALMEGSTEVPTKTKDYFERACLIIDYLVLIALESKSSQAIHYSKVIAVCISRTTCCPDFIAAVTSRITPQSMVAHSMDHILRISDEKCKGLLDLYTAKLDDIPNFSNTSRASYAPGQILLILIGT
jgi:hypothetical protein